MTSLDTAKLFAEVKHEAAALALPYNTNVRYLGLDRCTRSLGRCRKQMGHDGHTPVYTITISRYIGTLSLQEIKDVMMHELIHTIPGCFNHSAQFTHFADMINRKSQHVYHIKSCYEGKAFQQNTPYKYVIECRKCGQRLYRTRRSQITEHPSHYHCACGGSFQVYEVVRK